MDYAGQTVEVMDGSTGELRTAQVFVAVLEASNYTYAEATWTQGLPDWIGAPRLSGRGPTCPNAAPPTKR